MKLTLEAVLKYAEFNHLDTCDSVAGVMWGTRYSSGKPCTCGLAALAPELEKLRGTCELSRV